MKETARKMIEEMKQTALEHIAAKSDANREVAETAKAQLQGMMRMAIALGSFTQDEMELVKFEITHAEKCW